MKRSSICSYSAILSFLISVPAWAQVSVTGGSRYEAPQHVNVAEVDEKLREAADMMRAQPPKYGQAIATLTEATRMAPQQDAVWYRLGVAYLQSENEQSDAAEKAKRSTEAYNDLHKAIDLYNQQKIERLKEENSNAPCNIEGVCTHVEKVKVGAVSDEHKIAVYYSNLGDAAARLGKTDEASKDFQEAAQLDSADAGTYYFDLGVILRNVAKTTDQRRQAVEAFDHAIAADPNKAVAYYLKGEVLFSMSTTDSEGKFVALPGTIEALQKYLQLQPNSPYAEQANSFLAALNAPVERSKGTNKGTNKEK